MPPTPSKSLLTSKKGPFPVWGWALGLLALAYFYSRYKANKTAAPANTAATGTGTAGEPATGAPQYIIENNLPPSPSAPVTVTMPPPVATPPGTAPQPPTNAPPPVQSGGAIDQGGTATHPVTPTPAPKPPPAPAPAPAPRPVSKPPHTVVPGDSYSKIAQENGVQASGNTPAWQVLYNYNIGPNSPHSAAARAKLQSQGPNLIYSGQTIYIPS